MPSSRRSNRLVGEGANPWRSNRTAAGFFFGRSPMPPRLWDDPHAFAATLRAARTEVRILSRPFDIESDKPLRSVGDARAQGGEVPKFSLRLARPL